MADLTKKQVLAAHHAFQDEVRQAAKRAMGHLGLTWRDIDIDEIGIVAGKGLRLYERACLKHNVIELRDGSTEAQGPRATEGKR